MDLSSRPWQKEFAVVVVVEIDVVVPDFASGVANEKCCDVIADVSCWQRRHLLSDSH